MCGHGFFGEFHDGFQIGDGGVVQFAAALFPVAEGGEDAVGTGEFLLGHVEVLAYVFPSLNMLKKLASGLGMQLKIEFLPKASQI